MTTETKRFEDGYKAIIEILPDEFPEDPRETGTCGVIEVFESKNAFWDKANEIFGSEKSQESILSLVEGNPVVVDGKVWFGIERYRHSGDVLAVCKMGNFPDRQFDVSPIVGFVSFNENDESEFFSGFDPSNEELVKRAKERAKSHLETYNGYLSGDVWQYTVVVEHLGEEIDRDSMGGIDDFDAAKEYAADAVKEKIEKHAGKPVKEKQDIKVQVAR